MKHKLKNYPIFLNLDHKKILIIGGGDVAYAKLSSLLDFYTNIDIYSLEFSPKILNLIQKHNLVFKKTAYYKELLSSYDIIIATVNDIELQKQICFDAKEAHKLCSCADLAHMSDFSFASIIKEGDLSIAIGTLGISPAFSKSLKEHIKKTLPKGIGQFLLELSDIRKSMPKGKERMEYLKDMVRKFFNKELVV